MAQKEHFFSYTENKKENKKEKNISKNPVPNVPSGNSFFSEGIKLTDRISRKKRTENYGNLHADVQADLATRSLKIEEAEWLTSKEAADYLRISEGTLRNMASNGRVPYVKLGRSNRYSRSQLNQLLLSKKRGVLNGY